jgi:MFS family permease
MFFLLLLVMVLLATTELGTDSWIADIMRTVLGSPTLGTLFLVWTSFIMFVLRFFAGPIVHRIGPLGLLAASAAIAAVGLFWLSIAGSAPVTLFVAATFYGLGKTFFWPTTLGVVSEQYPRGGALMLNAIAGVGMISVGTIGAPAIGALQDRAFAEELRGADVVLADEVLTERPGIFGRSLALDPAKRSALAAAAAANPGDANLQGQMQVITELDAGTKQGTLGKIAVLPAIMLLCYLALIAYFRTRGGYRAVQLGVEGGGAGP